jgi:hypothetical protein
MRLSLSALQNFLESPLQAWMKTTLGLHGRDEERENHGDEPLQPGALVRNQILTDAFWSGVGDWDATELAYQERWELERMRSSVPVGLFSEIQRQQDLVVLRNWLNNTAPFDLGPMNQWVRLRVGHGRELSKAQEALPAIEVQVSVPSGSTMTVEIHGDLLPFHPAGHTTLACTTAGKMKFSRRKQRYLLRGFLNAVALSAAGRTPGNEVRVIVAGASPMGMAPLHKVYAVPDAARCRTWLQNLAADLLVGAHAYRMPIEAVSSWKTAVESSAHAAFVVRGEETSDRFGPVDDPSCFPVPDTDAANAMIRRRFGLWFEAGGG